MPSLIKRKNKEHNQNKVYSEISTQTTSTQKSNSLVHVLIECTPLPVQYFLAHFVEKSLPPSGILCYFTAV